MNRRSLVIAMAVGATFAMVDPTRIAPEVRDLPLTQALLVAVPALAIAALVDWPSVGSAVHRSPAAQWWTAGVLWLIVSGVASHRPTVGLATGAAFLATAGGVVELGRGSREYRSLALGGILAATLAALWGAGLLAAVMSLGPVVDEGRLASVTIEPNHLALVAALVAVAATGAVTDRSQPPRIRTGARLVLVLAAITLGATDSRTALAATAAGVLVLVAARAGVRRSVIVVGFGITILGALSAVGVLGDLADGVRRSSDDPLGNLAAVNGRTAVWPLVVDQIRERPLLGVGPGLDREVMVGLYSSGRAPFQAEHAHNLVLHVGLVGGVIGALVLGIGLLRGLRDLHWRQQSLVAALTAVVLVDGFNEAVLATPGPGWMVLTAAATWTGADDGPAPDQMASAPSNRRTSTSISVTARR